MKLGFTLPNRGVLYDATTAGEMLDLAEIADQSGPFQSVWVGDSLFGKPRMESIALLAGIAGRTKQRPPRPRLHGQLSPPRSRATRLSMGEPRPPGRRASVLVACTGIVPEQGGFDVETATYGVTNKDRVERLTEWITILKRLWTEDDVSSRGSSTGSSTSRSSRSRPPNHAPDLDRQQRHR